MFGSEFVVMQIIRDLIVSIHYNLYIFGVMLDGTYDVMCDNQRVVNNTSLSQ